MGKLPVINGETGKSLVYGAVGVLIVIMVSITAIIISGKTVPDFFYTGGTLLIGFLVGSRVVTPDVSSQVTQAAQDKAVGDATRQSSTGSNPP